VFIKKIIFIIALMGVFSSSWAQIGSAAARSGVAQREAQNIQSGSSSNVAASREVVAIREKSYPTPTSESLSCWYDNAISSCAALAKYTGTFTSLLTYSADSKHVGMRFYMNVTAAVGNGGCYNTENGTTLAVISYNPNPALTPGTMAFQQQQDWRNMALMAKASGQIVTIFTDGNCNVLDMQLD
jgi:hypothetical protein